MKRQELLCGGIRWQIILGYALLLLLSNPIRAEHESRIAEALFPVCSLEALEYQSFGLFSVGIFGEELVTVGAFGGVVLNPRLARGSKP